MLNLGKVRPGSTIRVPFGSYAAATGASSATTNLAAADVQIYKDGGTTQRASASGITVTADFDGLTGINFVSIDLADNTTADFYAAGSEYVVVIADVTIDTQTVRFPIARFVIGMDNAVLDTTIATLASQTSFTLATGSADNNAYVGCVAYIHNAASGVQCAMGVVSAYTGSTKTVTLAVDPGIFTMAAKDNISLLPRVNVHAFGGTAVTGRDIGASVLLSAGTGAGQLDFTTGVVKANTTQLAGQTVTAGAGVTFPSSIASPTNITAGTITTVTNLTNAPTNGDFTATMKTSIGTAVAASAVASVTGNVGGNVVGSVGSVATGGITRASFSADSGHQSIRSNTAQAGASGTITLDASASATDDFYNNANILITGGTGAGQLRHISDYVGSTKVATIKPAWTTTPDNTSTFAVLPAGSPFDHVTADHLVSGSTGSSLNAAGSAGDPWSTSLPGAYGAGTAGKIVGDNLNATVSSRLASASYTAPLDAAGTRTAIGLASANLDTQLDALPTNSELATALAAADDAVLSAIGALSIPTATENADALLARDIGSGSGAGTLNERTVRAALRFIRNKWSISGTTLTVTKEDDTTTAWSATVSTSAGADPVVGNDPA